MSTQAPENSGSPSALELTIRAAVLRALDSEDVTGLMAIAQADPLTTARYLKVANSPRNDVRRPVGSAATAMQLIGCRTAAMLALASCFDYGFNRRRDDRLEGVRLHCLQTAVLAQALSTGTVDGQEEFAAGLLHEILSMLGASGASADVMAGGAAAGRAQGSALLLRSWHLPRGIVNSVAALEHAQRTGVIPASGPGRVVCLAHELANLLGSTTTCAASDLAWFSGRLNMDTGSLQQRIAAAQERFSVIERYCG